MKPIASVICALSALTSASLAAAADDSPLFDVPRVDKIKIDGDLADWGDRGFRVEMLAGEDGRTVDAKDFDATFRLGWTKKALLVAATVRDDEYAESGNVERLWQGDGIELFVAAKRGSPQLVQVVIAPGLAKGQPKLRYHVHDRRQKRPADQTAEAARKKTAGGYTLEAALPWQNVPVSASAGREVAFQICFNDRDTRNASELLNLTWYPRYGTHRDSTRTHRIRLAAAPSPPVRIRAGGSHDVERFRTRVTVTAQADQAGKAVEVVEGGKTLAKGKLAEDDTGRASAQMTFPMSPVGRQLGWITVRLAGKDATTISLPGADRKRAEMLLWQVPTARAAVFSGTKLPDIRFERPLWVEAAIGPYELKTTYYDKDYSVVTSAKSPGRYGAVVEVVPRRGRAFRRMVTLFRCPGNVSWWRYRMKATITLPHGVGVSPQVLASQPQAVGEFVNGQILDTMERGDRLAKLLAGLYETRATDPKDDFYLSPSQRDRQWWVGLKRKIYGWDKRFPKPVVCPRPIEGKPAPVVREGTLEQAGMKADAAGKIDAVLTAWSADTDEAFAVCVVRRGVIVLHKAYGRRDGTPMTVTTKSWMASTTKMLSGTLNMMLVDQGLIDLDDLVSKYLPPLGGLKTSKPLTIRHLYTHTSGLEWHWGNDANDMAERIAHLWPHLEVGKRFGYNGTGMELACKILEAVSGESLPSFYRQHLLGSLGCENTDVGSASHDAQSVPLDMARIAQMLLNKGAYGKMRFLSVKTFEKILPRRLTKVLGDETQVVYGIGTSLFKDPGLGQGTFAHGAASSATTRIDPVNDLVIVMTRNTAGRNFGKYHQRFIDAIVEGMAD